MSNEIVDTLLRRGFGGADSAVVPHLNALPSALASDPPAGVEEVRNLVLGRMNGSLAPVPTWVFMLGGPGNGKSHQLSELLSALGVTSPPSLKLADRLLTEIKTSAGALIPVNDATIRPVPAPQGGHLLGDLTKALNLGGGRPDSLWVNINRGVLIEELPQAEGAGGKPAVIEVIKWLLQPDREFQHVEPQTGMPLPPWMRRASLGTIDIIAVSLDQVSLFEPSVADAFEATSAPLLPLRDDRAGSPAGRLLARIVDEQRFELGACHTCPAQPSCPFVANAASIREGAAKGLLQLARASELATGQLFTYRDVWALFASAIVGRQHSAFVDGPAACGWVASNAANLDVPQKRDTALAMLSLQRLQYSLFESVLPSPFLGVRQQRLSGDRRAAIVQRLADVDPVLAVGEAWATPVFEALSAVSTQELPTVQLTEKVPLLSAALHPLDEALEKRLLFATAGKGGGTADHVAFFGAGLYRLTALVLGHSAFEEEMSELVELWNAARINRHTEVRLARAIRNLVVGSDVVITLPVVASRADPKAVKPGTIVATISTQGPHAPTVNFQIVGTQVVAVLTLAGKRELNLPVDLKLAREALARLETGFTEASGATNPRLERSRAALLSAAGARAPLSIFRVEQLN